MSTPSKLRSELRTKKSREKHKSDLLDKSGLVDYVKSLVRNPSRYNESTKSHILVKKDKEGYLISVEEN